MGVIGHNARTWQTYHETVTSTAIELAETRIAMVCLGILSANNSVLLAAFDLPYPFADHKLVRAPKTHCGPPKLCALQLWVLQGHKQGTGTWPFPFPSYSALWC